MTDRECREILKELRHNTANAYMYDNKDRDVEAYDHVINILSDRILDEEHKSSMYEQVAKAFGKEAEK